MYLADFFEIIKINLKKYLLIRQYLFTNHVPFKKHKYLQFT